MEMKGKVIAVMAPKSGDGKNGAWKMQEFVIETDDRYPNRLCFEVWGEEKLAKFNINMGDMLVVKFDVDATERNGRWWPKNKAYEVTHE